MRIEPLQPPYDADVEPVLVSMMPPGVPPIALFRTFARNLPMTDAMRGWGSYVLGRRSSLSLRHRELAIDRTCARCGCEYEWGVHVAFFGERAGLDAAQVRSLTHGAPTDPCWTDASDRAVLRVVDALHETSTVDDELWREASSLLSTEQLLDLVAVAGWYHAISFLARATGVPLEEDAPRFADVEGP